jgi:hypothetical protein
MVWTTEKIAFLKTNYESMSKQELATALGFKWSQVRDKISKLKLTLPSRKKWERQFAGFRQYKDHVKFTEEEDSFVKENYLTMTCIEMSKTLSRSRTAIEYSLERQHLSIPQSLIEEHKQRGQFKKGQIPHNKSVKMPTSTYEKVKKTMFKKGDNRVNASVTLSDNYLKWVIAFGEDATIRNEIPPELIKLKRAELTINRELKKIKKNGH